MALDSTNIDQSHKSCYSCQPNPKEKKSKSDKKKKNHNLLRITRRLALEAFMAWEKSDKVERNLIKFDSLPILFVRLDSFQGKWRFVTHDLNCTPLLDARSDWFLHTCVAHLYKMQDYIFMFRPRLNAWLSVSQKKKKNAWLSCMDHFADID